MRKTLIFLLIMPLFVLLGTIAHAETEYDFGTDILQEAVPPEAAEILENGGVTPEGGGAVSFDNALGYLGGLLADKASAPLRLLVALCGVALLCGLSGSLADGGRLSSVFTTVGVLAGAGMTVAAVSEVLGATLELLSTAALFITTFIPIFAGVLTAMGRTAAATAANAVTLAATQLFSQLAVNFLAPLCGAIMGLSITGAVHPQLNTARIGEVIRKVVVWGLSLLMTVFMSILSVQTFVANSADSVFIRTAKFAVSSGVPIVGGTISDAVSTVHGSLELIRSSVGSYGLVAAAVIILPTLINVACYRLALTAAEAVSDIFGVKELSALLKSCGAVMSIIIAVIVCFLLLNTIAAVIMLAMHGGTA